MIELFHSVPNRTDAPKREPRGNSSAVVKPNMHNPILWDLVLEELHSVSNQPRARGNLLRDRHSENILTKEQRSSLTRREILAGQLMSTSLQTQNFVSSLLCFVILKTMKQ